MRNSYKKSASVMPENKAGWRSNGQHRRTEAYQTVYFSSKAD